MHRSIARALVILAIVFAHAAFGAAAVAAATCEELASLALPNTKILSAQVQPAGRFTPPGLAPPAANAPAPGNPALANLPAFCRVTASLTPTTDSDIRIEVWLPSAGWNGKLQSVGNGGWAGTIGYAALGGAIAEGYAAAATDTGHVGNTAKFASGHPEKLADYGYRAVHEMTVAAKAIMTTFYGAAPRLSYWNGCSTGGRQGLMEALRYPNDYDGIIAGAPVNFRTHQLTWALWVAQAVHKDEASYIPPTKYPAIHQAALDACDTNDGLKDGLIDDPTRCRFDPQVLACTSGDTASCLTPPQVEAARKVYSPAVNPRTKEEIFPALQPGSELGWGGLAGPQAVGEAVEFFQCRSTRRVAGQDSAHSRERSGSATTSTRRCLAKCCVASAWRGEPPARHALPDHHDDPFDRLFIVQARHEGLTIVTSDTAFDDYDVPVLDARA